MLKTVASEHKLLVTLEENVENGGFGEHVLRYLTENHLQTEFLACAIPDEYVEHGNVELLKQEVGIDGRRSPKSDIHICVLLPDRGVGIMKERLDVLLVKKDWQNQERRPRPSSCPATCL